MSDPPIGDWQRWQDEIERCRLLSLDMTISSVPQERTAQLRRAKRYAERARVLEKVGPERGVAFLREEALRALSGTPETLLEGWYRLHHLEFGGPPFQTVLESMIVSVEKMITEGVIDRAIEYSRTNRPDGPLCEWCHDPKCDHRCLRGA